MSKLVVQFSKRAALLFKAAAFLASFIGFGWLLLSLHHEGLKTRAERLYYLPYQLVQAEQAKLDQARAPLKLNSREIELGVYEHTLEIQSSELEKWNQISEIGLDVSSPSEWQLESAEISFLGADGTLLPEKFACKDKKTQGTNSGILLHMVTGTEKVMSAPQPAILTIRGRGSAELSVWVQKSVGKPVSPILWASVPNTEGAAQYASLSGWFRYSDEVVQSYSKAQLLAYTWGFGVDGSKIIYAVVGLGSLIWIVGLMLLFAPPVLGKMLPWSIVQAMGCSLLFASICLIYSILFPPFHGPDEPNHFLTFTKITGQESIEKNSLELANQGAFQRIHRRGCEKFSASDVRQKRDESWPPYCGGAYPLDRSPLERVYWQLLGHLMPSENASAALLQLRVANGIFVASCLLMGLAVAGSIFADKLIAAWWALPVLLIPCIAHYSTVVSNYPYLIGGYVIQMVVLGALWASLDSPLFSRPHLAKIGTLLGAGLAIALCSADNAVVTLPFWEFILPVYFMARRDGDETQLNKLKDAGVLIGAMIGMMVLLCTSLAPFCINHSFLPGRTSSMLVQHLPVHGSQFLAGIALLVVYSTGIYAVTCLLCGIRVLLHKITWRVPWRSFGLVGLVIIVILLLQYRFPPVPEIDLSRGGNTTAIKYAVTVVGAFVDSLLPGKPDEMAETFWRRLGWQETQLPEPLMDVLRLGVGFGIILLLWRPIKEKGRGRIAAFAVANVIAVALCLAVIGILYYMVLFNVNSRYILIGYLLSAMLAAEGYRRFILEKQECIISTQSMLSGSLIMAIELQSWSWTAIINRFF